MNGEITRAERIGLLAQAINELGFGAFVPNEQISEFSGYSPGSQEFSFFVTGIRNQLVEEGKWLSGEGRKARDSLLSVRAKTPSSHPGFQGRRTVLCKSCNGSWNARHLIN